MSLRWQTRSGSTRKASATLVALALFAVLTARNVPPVFAATPFLHSTIQAVSSHDQRPRFEYDGTQWSIPAGDFQLIRPSVELVHSATITQFFPILRTKGSHYNRPPPR